MAIISGQGKNAVMVGIAVTLAESQHILAKARNFHKNTETAESYHTKCQPDPKGCAPISNRYPPSKSEARGEGPTNLSPRWLPLRI